jgi:lactate permease
LPIGFLIYVMTKEKVSEFPYKPPIAAILVYRIVPVNSRLDPNLVNANVVNSILSALTPISIIWGAILLSQTMRSSGAEQIIGDWLKEVSPNPVAQLMIVGMSFPIYA